MPNTNQNYFVSPNTFLLRSSFGILLLFFSMGVGFGQSFIGFTADNYAGIHAVSNNPAFIVDSRYRVDVNLGSFSGFGGSDNVGINFLDLATDPAYVLKRDAEFTNSEENSIYGNVDIMGPSFMFNLSPKYAIGLLTRVRAFANINRVNGTLFENAWRKFDGSQNFDLVEDDFNSTFHGWTEFGIAFGAILADQGKHFIKSGLTLKYLKGLGAGTADGLNVNASYRNNDVGANTLTTSGEITYILSEGYYINEEFDYGSSPTTIGADVGFVYEYRPEHERYYSEDEEGNRVAMKDKNKYRFRAAISLTDIGSTIGYNNATLRNYNLNQTIDASELSRGDVENRLDEFYLNTEVQKNDVKIYFPTAAHINLDWNVKNYLFLNINSDISLRSPEKIRSNRKMSSFVVTPRYERKWISVYSPISLRQQGDFAFGIGLRAGPVFIGSGSVFSNLINQSAKTTDVHFGLKVPLFHKATGPIGDPVEEVIEDRDNDGVLDADDLCPDIPGSVKKDGCPEGLDSDGDNIPDDIDECPDTAGTIALNGCPDADNDGIADIDDVCPELAGVADKNGCPDNISGAVPTINNFANIILFKYSKSSFQEASFYTLNSIVDILTAYPKSTFVIEGHTDSSGSEQTNMKLSIDRAEAVRDYFVANGIDYDRFKTVGYGESRPLSNNVTEEGRAINRRVVVKLLSAE